MDDSATECSKALLYSAIDHIRPSSLPMTLEFKPGVKAVNGTSLEMGTLGNYTLCFQAIVEDRVCTFCISSKKDAIISIYRRNYIGIK